MTPDVPVVVDGLQYCNWSEPIFRQMRAGGVTAVHVTVAYHENFRETVANIERWDRWFERFPGLICRARSAEDVRRAHVEKRTAIIFGAQNCSPIEDDIGLIDICHVLGLRFMQLSYNNQSLLATGCYEATDAGLTRMGRQVIRAMNRVGMVVDMSHSAELSTLQAIEASQRPIAITHANPHRWHPAKRNKSDAVLRALAESGGMLGFSLYPHHLRDGSACTLESFCTMVAQTAELMGVERIGIGSDLCQGQPDGVVEWMRNGRWSRDTDFGEGSADKAGFPPQPRWFADNRDFRNLRAGLRAVGFADADVAKILGLNWLRFFELSFGPAPSRAEVAATSAAAATARPLPGKP
jgi:microsomal dipeptidase-like Zn-dependent dipeptidase